MMPQRTAELNAALESGEPLTIEQLAYHLSVDRKYAPQIARSFGLKPEGHTYPWRRIWRHIHGIEGTRLLGHLAKLKAQYPGSVLLDEIDDLGAALRTPLISFAAMAARLGRKPDTLSKALRDGRETLPFPMIRLGLRTRNFRDLEVRLWVEEEIRLELPAPPVWLDWTAVPSDPAEQALSPAQGIPAPANMGQSPLDQVKKAIFGGFAEQSRSSAI